MNRYTFKGYNNTNITVVATNKQAAMIQVLKIIKKHLPKYTWFINGLDINKRIAYLQNSIKKTTYKLPTQLNDLRMTCGVFIINKYGEVVVGRVTGSNPVRWDIPKGQIDVTDDNFWEAAIRETKEESNIDLKFIISNSNTTITGLPYYYYNKNKFTVSQIKTVAKYFIVETDFDFRKTDLFCASTFTNKNTGEVRPEFDIVKFVKLDELPNIHYSQLKVLSDYKFI